MTDEEARKTVQQLVDFVLPKLPREYDGDKHWGDTKRLWAGVKLRRDGLKLSTKRRWREVKHGRWTKYSVRMPGSASSPPPIKIDVRSVQPNLIDGVPTGMLIATELRTPLDFSARIQRWNLGLHAYSIEISGHLNVRMTLQSTLNTYPDYSEIPPAIVVDPRVKTATLVLESFHVDRISKIGGEVAEQWGEIAEAVAKEIFLEDLNAKLPAKLNQAIDKKRDSLRWSTSDWLTGLVSTPTSVDQ